MLSQKMLMLQRFSQDHLKVMTLVIHIAGIGKGMLCSQIFWIVQERRGPFGCTKTPVTAYAWEPLRLLMIQQ
jgi:hypothetical protein